jgi:hypothetical protein
MPTMPVGSSTLRIELWCTGASQPLGVCSLKVARSEMGGEGHQVERRSLQLTGNLGELVGYIHVRCTPKPPHDLFIFKGCREHAKELRARAVKL